MAATTQQYEGIILGRKQDSYLVRLVDLVHEKNPDVKSLMSRDAFPREHRSLEPGALFFWTIDQGRSNVLVSDVRV
jgi:hypothetical protein